MSYVFILLFIFMLYSVGKSYLNKYGLIFIATTLSLIVIMYVAFSLIAMAGFYPSSYHWFRNLDKHIFLNIVNRKVYTFTLTKVYNLASALFFCSITMLININTHKKRTFKILTPSFLTVLIFSAIYNIFYHPEVTLSLHAIIYKRPNTKLLIYFFDMFMHIGTYLILAYPLYIFVKNLSYLISTYKKRQLFGVAGYIILSNLLYIILTRISALRTMYFLLGDSSIIQIQSYTFRYNYEYLLYVAIMMLVMVFNFYITSRFKVLHNDGIITNFFLKKKKDSMNKNFYQILHGVKNIILSYKITLSEVLNTENPEEKEQIIRNLNNRIEEYLNHMSSILNANLNLSSFYESSIYTSDILDSALAKLNIPDTITVEKKYSVQKEEIMVDALYFTDALHNIIENAVQALLKSEHENKTLSISVDTEFSWTVITISDNGIGMDRVTRKHMFEPFYSSKSRIHNWGIGLYYAKNIIEQHKGKISVKSKAGHGTVFYILLPKV